MSAQLPPHGQISPDGRWWWDGTKWVPVQTSSQTVPQLPAPLQQPAVYPPAVYIYGPRSNSYAVASLVIGILSWFLCPVIGAVIAVTLGHTARGQIRRSGEGGAGLAMAGLILGYAHLAFFGIFILFWLVVFGGMAALLGAISTMPVSSPSP